MVTILDENLDRVAQVDDLGSVSYQRAWQSAGAFEITINENTLYAKEFRRDRYVMIDNDPYRVGVIEHIERSIDQDGAGGETLTARGREALSMLDRRLLLPPSGQDNYATTAVVESAIKSMIKDSLGSTATASRQMAEFTIATDQGRGPTVTISHRFKNLLEAVSDACLATGIGVFCYLDFTTKKFVIDCGISRDMTAESIFSTDIETLKSARLTDSATGYKNLAIVGGQGDGKDRVLRTVFDTVEPTGKDRREYFVDARDLSVTASLDARGAQKLAEVGFEKFIEAQALEYSQISYQLGDLCLIRQFDTEQVVRITGITNSWVAGQYSTSLQYDKFKPTLPGQVSKIMAQSTETANRTEIPQGLRMADSPTFATVHTPQVDNSGGALSVFLPKLKGWSDQVEYDLVPFGGVFGPGVKLRYDSATTNRFLSFGMYNNSGGWGQKLALNDGNVDVTTFSRFGADAGAPAIKMKKLTGTTASSEGGITAIAHGLTGAKILSVSVFVSYTTNSGVPPGHPINQGSGYNYDTYYDSGNVNVRLSPTESENILIKPITVLIIYEE